MLAKLYYTLRWRAERHLGYDTRNWLRLRQIESFVEFLSDRPNARILEVSPGWNRYWKERCKNYTSVEYPDFDICKAALHEQFDIVIADQVLEHVQRPIVAAKNIYSMVAGDGYAMVATPFLFRVHARPHDFQRWTEAGLKQLLVEGGFAETEISTASWGNKSCARAHIGGPVRDYGWFRDMHNDPEYPLMVWAFARKLVT